MTTISSHYPRMSFVTGAASVFDLRGRSSRMLKRVSSPEEADRIAVSEDWAAVGRDLSSAFQHVAHPVE